MDPSESQYFDPHLTDESSTQLTTSHSNPSMIPIMTSYKGTGFTPEQWKVFYNFIADISTLQQPQ